MKQIKEMMGHDLMRKIKSRWKVEPRNVVNDGSKYGSQNDEDWVRNPIVGTVQVRELKRLELEGVLMFDGCWRVPRQLRPVEVNGKKVYPVSYKYHAWVNENVGPSREQRVDAKAAKQALFDDEIEKHMPGSRYEIP